MTPREIRAERRLLVRIRAHLEMFAHTIGDSPLEGPWCGILLSTEAATEARSLLTELREALEEA